MLYRSWECSLVPLIQACFKKKFFSLVIEVEELTPLFTSLGRWPLSFVVPFSTCLGAAPGAS